MRAWRASLPGKFNALKIDGNKTPAENATRAGGTVESYQVLQVRRGETHIVSWDRLLYLSNSFPKEGGARKEHR